MTKVKLTASDGTEFFVEKSVIIRSNLIRGLLCALGDSAQEIPLAVVTTSALEKVLEYCTYHKDDPLFVEEDECPSEPKPIEDVDPWDYRFANIDKGPLFDLITAANYLDIKPLITVCCRVIANMIRGKSEDEVRNEFNQFSKR
ncbi:hypothetical protein DSO57_1032568 [Entomophthora muscae]|uniref:Uncharacterized protein n=1 Tax=Entomophthora muscae TaxID=34485 RepID=A0ACC2TMC5_9FUNG|nr:hypothetical protein DSO57_1032568 [Entomophthora muscae]